MATATLSLIADGTSRATTTDESRQRAFGSKLRLLKPAATCAQDPRQPHRHENRAGGQPGEKPWPRTTQRLRIEAGGQQRREPQAKPPREDGQQGPTQLIQQDATTSFAPLLARYIAGAVRLRDQNGAVRVLRAKGSADLATSFASLRAEGIEGDAILANQDGAVTAEGITGSVSASSSFGTMNITGAGRSFVCHNQNGALRLHATSTALTNIEARTSFGTLEVWLPARLKPAIQARTSFAQVESDFPVLMKPRGEDAFAGVGPGTPHVRLRNQNGKIRVVRD